MLFAVRSLTEINGVKMVLNAGACLHVQFVGRHSSCPNLADDNLLDQQKPTLSVTNGCRIFADDRRMVRWTHFSQSYVHSRHAYGVQIKS